MGHRQMKQVAILFSILLLAPISIPAQSCGDFPAPGFDDPKMRHFTGSYSNPNYGFAVKIPKGITGHDIPAPAPHHGFGVVLSWEPRAYMDFDGSYNALELSLPETENQNLERLRESSESLLSVSSKGSKLGRLDARRQVVRHNCKGHAKGMLGLGA